MAGDLTGLDMLEALASVPSGLDVDALREFFAVAEFAFLAAMHKGK